MNPFVSVVVPTYNRSYPLAELLESLSRQIYRHFEVVIVNDGGARVEQVVALYPELQVNVIHLEKNIGHVEARNIGVKAAKGELVMLCDDDDLLLPCHMERMVSEITDVDFVYSDVEIFHYKVDNGQRVPTDRFLFAYEYDKAAMRKFSTYVPSGSLYRKDIHVSLGYFDPHVHNYWDWDFFLRVSETFRIKRVAAASVLYAFSQEGDHLSRQMSDKRQMYLNRLSEKHGLGPLPTKNFWLLLQEPEVAKRKAGSQIIWDGKPVISRLCSLAKQ
ncbi:glycosyltransferase family 2 protein [Thermaerobacillus caldiproteolyticus]|uniref:Glycosyltransferase involved in cell wall biosynthesis n=1 Tax=Thermaerobacillus caldiproteolyticus TaxID=247480 RepID=A0A7V9Z5G9_9BACL|nr:glycosyltransferase family 2 protein [Anoxybacillus caldiproteolyticus]MBA2874412.1 glycosyltransferase involved in cell wall biosynthesis [Anoxybacillus caldiproteolyticus]QPA30885.1 glycosyltransferase family 2 protein [Anoxybacillus caldiproteolyticus]